jgi:hypothetical protein
MGTNNMHCPSCGKEFGDGVKFCRACGFALGPVAELLAGNDEKDIKQSWCPADRSSVRVQGIGLMIFAVLIGIANAMLRDFDLFPARWGKLLFLFFFVMGVIRLVYSVFGKRGNSLANMWPENAGSSPKPAEVRSQEQPAIMGMNARDEIPIMPPSVTERTTRHLVSDR